MTIDSAYFCSVLIIHAPKLFYVLTLGSRKHSCMAVWPIVISRKKAVEISAVVKRHERIHFEQQKELLLIGFFLWYSLEFLFRWIATGDRYGAYMDISFEKEAYRNQEQADYLKKRRRFAWIKWLNQRN